ncbi:MAG: alpha-mannosidase [Chloroflexota bacterium]
MDRPTTAVHSEDRAAAESTLPAPEIRFWIVPHTHWDREWFIPFQVIRLKLVRMVDELMDTLEADPSFTSFTLDGQAVVLEDYLAARPESEARIARLIQQGRIRIGPSYILPDEYLVGQESLVRNLIVGRQICRRFGSETPVAYYPDTFGHVAQMPQIVRGFGMDSFVFWRGLGDDSDRLGIAFRWRGPDGSELLAMRQIDGYGAVDNLGRWARGGVRAGDPAEYTEMALRRLRELRDIATPYLERSGVTDLLAGNGTDHQLVQQDLTSLLSAAGFAWPQAEFHIAGLDEYADAIRGRVPFLDIYEGEMCDGKDAPVLRGVNSARIHLKQRNEAVERALLEAEIAASLAYLAKDAPYPAEDLRMAWRDLLRNHPHDSICGCSVDEVHRDMAWRFDAAEQLAVRLRREALWKLADGEAIWSYQERPNARRTAVNLMPWRRRGLVELPLPNELAHARSIRAEGPDGELPAQLVRDAVGAVALVAADAPALGASAIRLRSGRSEAEGARLVGYRALENEHYHVSVLPDGTLEILHRASGKKLSGAHWFEDEADRGDEYNFCPVDGDPLWYSRQHKVRVRPGMRGPAAASLILEMEARLPAGLRADRKARRRQTAACPIRVEVRLVAGVERVEFVTTLENRAQDHRLRVLFPAGAAHRVRAEGHYAVIQRPVGAKQHGPDWSEPAAPTHHTLGAVEAGGLLLLGKGLPEYEARHAGEGTEMALTLLRAVGWLSRDDLSTRPGGAGPHLATPEAQCPGTHRFEYAIALAEDLGDADLVRISHDYRFGLLAGPPGLATQQALHLEGEGFCLAALKGAEDGDGTILRVYNPGSAPASLAVSSGVLAQPCRLDEEPLEGGFDGALSGGKIASFRLRRPSESPLPLGEG